MTVRAYIADVVAGSATSLYIEDLTIGEMIVLRRLGTNTTLQSLYVSGPDTYCGIPVASLLNKLKHNTTLTSLSLTNVHIDPDVLKDVLSVNTTLADLTLLKIDTDGVIDILCLCTSLKMLDIRRVTSLDVARLITHNTTLSTLSVTMRRIERRQVFRTEHLILPLKMNTTLFTLNITTDSSVAVDTYPLEEALMFNTTLTSIGGSVKSGTVADEESLQRLKESLRMNFESSQNEVMRRSTLFDKCFAMLIMFEKVCAAQGERLDDHVLFW